MFLLGAGCVETDAYDVNLEPSGRITHAEETLITFNCSTDIPGLYPKWTINDQVYEITYTYPLALKPLSLRCRSHLNGKQKSVVFLRYFWTGK